MYRRPLLPQEKIGRGDVCESPFPRNVGDSLWLVVIKCHDLSNFLCRDWWIGRRKLRDKSFPGKANKGISSLAFACFLWVGVYSPASFRLSWTKNVNWDLRCLLHQLYVFYVVGIFWRWVLLNTLLALDIACVQTSPSPQQKSWGRGDVCTQAKQNTSHFLLIFPGVTHRARNWLTDNDVTVRWSAR